LIVIKAPFSNKRMEEELFLCPCGMTEFDKRKHGVCPYCGTVHVA